MASSSFFLLLVSLLVTTVHPLTLPSDISGLQSFISAIKIVPTQSCLNSWRFSTSDPCDPRHIFFSCGLQCDITSVPNRITAITLDSAGYSGSLSPLVSTLSALSVLDLSKNAFYGKIPPSLSNLKSLQTLVLSVNTFSGEIPPSIFSMKSLETLDLSYNSFTGSLPDSDFSPALQRLDASFNKLTGGVPKLAPKLIELALRGNKLSGSLVKSSFSQSIELEVVELAENYISGTLQPWFFDMPSLQQVDLANNTLTRIEIWKPVSSTGSSLVALDLGYNRLEGTFPDNLSSYPILSSLSLRYNRLRGPIPTGLGKTGSTLRRLFLDGNFFNGVPPQQLFYGTTAVSGSLGDNCLAKCPVSSELCTKSQKPISICRQAY